MAIEIDYYDEIRSRLSFGSPPQMLFVYLFLPSRCRRENVMRPAL